MASKATTGERIIYKKWSWPKESTIPAFNYIYTVRGNGNIFTVSLLAEP
jgi:hypothetical protein